MDPILIISFLGASILLTFMPGPDILFVLTESITKGGKTGRTIALGLVTGVLIHTAAAATGLSIIIYQSDLVFSIVKYLGAAYLFYLVYQAIIEKPIAIETNGHDEISSNYNFIKLFRKGFLMNVLNPKVSIFFIAFLPQFVSQNGFQPVYQMLLLGFVFIIQAFIIFSIVASLAGRLTRFLQDEKFWNISKWVKAFVLFAIGLSLILH